MKCVICNQEIEENTSSDYCYKCMNQYADYLLKWYRIVEDEEKRNERKIKKL